SVVGSTFRAVIDLRDGRISSVVGSPDGSGSAATGNLGIAFDAIIENATGGTRNDILTGNSAVNRLIGQGGRDTLSGLGGGDSLIGSGGGDTLTGGPGSDVLNGGLGVDRMSGGTGNDTFRVDDTDDTVIEGLTNGTDAVVSTASFLLPSNVEHLTLADTAERGTGNELANKIAGNTAANVLVGDSGNDTLSGVGGGDVLHGGSGEDVLNGGGGNDRLVGAGGADRLIGESGVDTLVGGTGNDRYVVDSASDSIVEAVGEGADVVTSTASFSLPDNVERLTLLGTANISATGNALANMLTGNNGANVLRGLVGADTILGNGGADTILGGAGSDSLQGDGGADVFRYGSVTHGTAVASDATRGTTVGDTIADFTAGTDGFEFVASAFDPAGAIGLGTLTLDVDFSVIGAQYDGTNADLNSNHTAGDATFVFSTADDTLYYDADAGAGYVVVATLGNGATLSASDIEIVAG
ncbi:MAG: calcium-binding protein, partial [Alphaproteobacteria bacterium]